MSLHSFAALYSTLTAERDIATSTGIPYGKLNRQRLDVYEPANGAKLAPIILFIYGGSWTSGERAIYGFVGAALATRGLTTVIPDYRLAPEVEFPAFVEDAGEAYSWVARTLSAACGERRPIVVMGHSAGAHIAALLALDRSYLSRAAPQYPGPAGLIGLAGPYGFDPTTWPSTKSIFSSAASRPDQARPIAFASSKAPPSLLIHGQADDVVKIAASQNLFNALKTAGADAQKIEYAGVGHIGLILTLSQPFRWRADTLESVVHFADRIGAGRTLAPCAVGPNPQPTRP